MYIVRGTEYSSVTLHCSPSGRIANDGVIQSLDYYSVSKHSV